MPSKSAGILLYRGDFPDCEFLLAHPGGPYWKAKDDGAWTIPKGLIDEGEDALAAAKREFAEETGYAPQGEAVELGAFRQPSGKVIHAWTMRGDFDVLELKSNLFSVEWPPKSGRLADFPEVDRAGWFSFEEAERKILTGQRPILKTALQALMEQENRLNKKRGRV